MNKIYLLEQIKNLEKRREEIEIYSKQMNDSYYKGTTINTEIDTNSYSDTINVAITVNDDLFQNYLNEELKLTDRLINQKIEHLTKLYKS